MIDDTGTQNIKDSKKWIFIVEVIHPNGKKYTNLTRSVPFYVQLGDDWDEKDVKAVFISPSKDESVKTEYISSLFYPEGNDEFMKLTLMHFSPYVIYDKDDENVTDENKENIIANDSNNDTDANDINITENGEKSTENEDTTNETTKPNNNFMWYIAAGSGVILISASLLWYLLIYKKRKKNKNILAKSIAANLAFKSCN